MQNENAALSAEVQRLRIELLETKLLQATPDVGGNTRTSEVLGVIAFACVTGVVFYVCLDRPPVVMAVSGVILLMVAIVLLSRAAERRSSR